MISSRVPTIRRRQGFFDGLPLIWVLVAGSALWAMGLGVLRSGGLV